jgi:hypothetical protein
MKPLDLAVATVAFLAFAWIVWLLGRTIWRLRGPRLVTCPETGKPVAVGLDVRYALAGAAVGKPQFRLNECSRWPERAHCGQQCLGELEAAPDDCLVRNILVRWYAGKSCAFCGRPFLGVHWHDSKPALRGPDGAIREWRELTPKDVPDVLRTHRPVCANCSVTEWLRHEHPELVVERPPRPGRGDGPGRIA